MDATKWQQKVGRESQECYFSPSRSALLTNLFLGTIQNALYLLKYLGQNLIKKTCLLHQFDESSEMVARIFSVVFSVLETGMMRGFLPSLPVQRAIWNLF